MKIVIPGGSGQVGRTLARAFVGDGHEVVVLSRRAGETIPGAKCVAWDARTSGSWTAELEGVVCVGVLEKGGCLYDREVASNGLVFRGLLDTRCRVCIAPPTGHGVCKR